MDQSHSFFDGTLDSLKMCILSTFPILFRDILKDATGLIKPELEVFQSTTGTKNVIFRANNNKTPAKFEFTYTKF